VRTRSVERWSRSLSEPLWGRAWLLWVKDPLRVVGHLELMGGRVPAEMHRAVLAMGMLRAYTGQGHGRRLIEVAIAWARTEGGLSWIDLGVFSMNEPARKLYSRMGFIEQGMRRDAFRLEGGISVDDIQMSLEL
jgi:RimJ/RimL family protein N-acetyltransferase